MTLTDRINQLLAYEGISARIFDEKVSKSDGYFRNQFRKKGGIGSEVLEKIHENFPHWNLYWIITGKGEMVLKNNMDLSDVLHKIENPEEVQMMIEVAEKENDLLKKLLLVKEDLINQLKKEVGQLKNDNEHSASLKY